jgi:hypothetical protein
MMQDKYALLATLRNSYIEKFGKDQTFKILEEIHDDTKIDISFKIIMTNYIIGEHRKIKNI